MNRISEHKQKQLDELRDVISFIATSTEEAAGSPKVRWKIANSITRAVNMSALKGGDVEKPEDTEIYRIARIIKDATSWEEFSKLAHNALPHRKPEVLLTKYNLKWKPRFTLPDDITKAIAPKPLNAPSHEIKSISKEDAELKIQLDLHKKVDELNAKVAKLIYMMERVLLGDKYDAFQELQKMKN